MYSNGQAEWLFGVGLVESLTVKINYSWYVQAYATLISAKFIQSNMFSFISLYRKLLLYTRFVKKWHLHFWFI